MKRSLDQIQREINEAYDEWHALLRHLEDGCDVTPAITDVEQRLDHLFAEKRWLKAGAIPPDLASTVALLDARLRMSLHKYRSYGIPGGELYGFPPIADQLGVAE